MDGNRISMYCLLIYFFAVLAFMKKWFWRVLLCIIIIITILGNMSERIGYRVYVQSEADTMSPIYFKDIHHLVIPLLNNHNVEKLIIDTGDERI